MVMKEQLVELMIIDGTPKLSTADICDVQLH